MGGDLFGALGFIVAAFMEADGEGLHRPRALRLHQRDHGRGIDAAGQERTKRHVGDHPQLDGIAKERVEPLDSLVWVRGGIVAPLASRRDAAQVPEAFRRRRQTLAQRQDVTGSKLLRLAIDGARLRDITVAQVADDRIVVDRRSPRGGGAKRLELRRKQNPLRRRRVVERLDAEAVACQHQASRLAVPQREGKHADRALDRGFDAPQRAGFKQHFGIGIAAHRTAGRLQLAADVAVIVDFAVEGDDVTPIRRMHRLRAAGTEIDDGEPALTERHAGLGLDPDRAGIGTAMPHRLDHGFADRAQRRTRGRRAPIDHARNAAHSITPTARRSRAPALVSSLPRRSVEIDARCEPIGEIVRPAFRTVYHTPRRHPVLI